MFVSDFLKTDRLVYHFESSINTYTHDKMVFIYIYIYIPTILLHIRSRLKARELKK
jgi:hypothetical protein